MNVGSSGYVCMTMHVCVYVCMCTFLDGSSEGFHFVVPQGLLQEEGQLGDQVQRHPLVGAQLRILRSYRNISCMYVCILS